MILTYHEIVAAKDCSYRYGVTVDRLREHLSVLQHRKQPAADSSAITFDDGHTSNYRYALPALTTCGMRATFFVTVEPIGRRPEVMNWAQLREMLSLGHAVECHSWSHKFLTECSDDELAEELGRSRRVLEDGLGAPVEAISMPGGRWNDRVLDACAREGYRRVYNSDAWRRPAVRKGVLLAGRLMVQNTMDAGTIEQLVGSSSSQLAAMQAKDAVKQGVKRVIGDHMYHRLWCALSREDERGRINAEYTYGKRV